MHVDEERREVRMYYHGWVAERVQQTKVAVSTDGVRFEAFPESLGRPYFRVWRYGGYYYAIGMPGVLYRSRDGLTGFEQGPKLFGDNMRHSCGGRRSATSLRVFYTNAGDSPEGDPALDGGHEPESGQKWEGVGACGGAGAGEGVRGG